MRAFAAGDTKHANNDTIPDFGCRVTGARSPQDNHQGQALLIFRGDFMKQQFNVQGMTCGHCEMAVKRAVLQLDPGAQVQIDRAQGKVEVDSPQPRAAVAQAIAEEGYQVS